MFMDPVEPKCSRMEKVQLAIALVLGGLLAWMTVT
jgi:hypothetical protein